MKKIVLPVLAASAIACAAPQTHDGFFLNLALGYGYMTYNVTAQAKTLYSTKSTLDLDYSGLAAELDVKLGGRIYDNLLLHATILATSGARNTRAELTIQSESGEYVGMSNYSNIQTGISFLGGGLTYYLSNNIFVTGSIGAGQLTMNTSKDEDLYGTDKGFAFQIGAGKEWWVSENWGLGAELSFVHSSTTGGDNGTGSANAIHLMFSATFN
ncbi:MULTISPECIES: outer membrane beta-barrel protein [unclassified Fibrobacter]|uniref:outer membrane beta-barrel protein n=1 Tax=unclassified Fibrobacter TaxID=2634177 RepID=UPI000D6DB993|nr:MULTISPECIES: outer membrane beta-barrel protein [unclassified Fibrobacter]PWJ60737.1 outer membrane protein with beta-barrel domain [Fibrobacter sp. UWR4]PZW64353.1 outer membrane protein with beta-barrel domain [Fibrobacter sp. UWR1]